ncbi:MAG: autotransporter outer membrane beta-barrel domain-containing protein, partial [Planctomycetota bacterium]
SGTGTVGGTFSSVNYQSDGLFLSFDLDYSADKVELVAERTPYNAVTLASTNQNSIASNLQVAAVGSTGDMREILDQIDQIQTVAAYQSALDQLSPEVYSGNTDANFAVTSAYNSGMAARMGEVRADAGRLGHVVRRRVPYGPSGPTGIDVNEQELITGIWAKPFYTWADQDGIDGHMGFSYDSSGIMAGYDRRYGNILLGISGGYAGSDIDYTGGVSARTDIDTYHLGAYGSYSLGRLYLDSGLSIAVNEGMTERMIRIGTVDRTARGDTEGETYTAFLTAGYNYALKDWIITPKATLQGSRFHQQGFKETWSAGGDGKNVAGMNLKVDSSTSSSFQSILGLSVGRSVDFKGIKLRPEVRAAWMHEYVDTERSVKARFANAPTTSGTFTVEGMKPESDSYGGGVGVTAYLQNKELFFNFDTEVRGDFTSNTISGGMRFEF